MTNNTHPIGRLSYDHAFDNNPLDGDRPDGGERFRMVANIHPANVARPHGPSLSLCSTCGVQMRYVHVFTDADDRVVPLCHDCTQAAVEIVRPNDANNAHAADVRMRTRAQRARATRVPSTRAARFLARHAGLDADLAMAYADDRLADMDTMLHTSGSLTAKQVAAARRIAGQLRDI